MKLNLGSDLPKKDIIKALVEFKPEIAIISATLQTSLLDVGLLIEEIHNEATFLSKKINIIIAGAAFKNVNYPAKKLKVDFYCHNLKNLLEFLEK